MYLSLGNCPSSYFIYTVKNWAVFFNYWCDSPILKVPEAIFWAEILIGPFEGFSRGQDFFWTSKLSWAQYFVGPKLVDPISSLNQCLLCIFWEYLYFFGYCSPSVFFISIKKWRPTFLMFQLAIVQPRWPCRGQCPPAPPFSPMTRKRWHPGWNLHTKNNLVRPNCKPKPIEFSVKVKIFFFSRLKRLPLFSAYFTKI